MSAAEIPHRIREAFLRQIGRFSFVVRRDHRLPTAILREDLPELPLNLHGLNRKLSHVGKSELNDDIDRICKHRLTLLGQQWPEGASSDWSLDPESGKHWRWHEYTFDIPRRSGQGPGDVKFVWELSRLQHLQVLALGAHVLGREDARELCLEYLDAWLRDNPPYQGLGYACGIELASRLISILVIVTCLGASMINEEFIARLWHALITHGRWIARFPSLYSSANNHLVAESAALFILGSISPKLPDAGDWRRIGWARLVEEAGRQILTDGVGAEQSPTYLAYTMEWLLLARAVYVSVHGTTETELDIALRRGAFFVASIADVNGNVPFIGDCDDGVVLRPKLQECNYLGSVVTATATCLQRGELLHPAFMPDLRSHMLTSNSVPESTLKLKSTVFPNGGYSIIRSSGKSKEVFLMLDHGPLGFAETAAHGHADALAIWLHLNGRPILIDFGTYRYNADAGWRAWARSTAAHNTVELNGESQSDMTGPFNWGKRARVRLLEHSIHGAKQFCRASHDGYADTQQITHERQVEVDGSALVAINDSLVGQGTHTIKLNFHFSKQVHIESLKDGEFAIRCNEGLIATIDFACPELVSNLIRQESELRPGPGAMSPEYNKLQSSASIVVSGRVQLPYSCRTTIRIKGLG